MQTQPALALILALSLIGSLRLNAGVVATSSTEFSGVQGQNGWFYGYRNIPADGAPENYDPDRDFIPFAGGNGQGAWNGTTQQWTGTGWKTSDGSEMTDRYSRPAGPTKWTIRRWQAYKLTEKGPVSLRWTLAKENTTCGNGVTGALYINGQLADTATITFDPVTTVTRTFYALLCPADRVDLALRLLETDGANNAQCDGILMTLVVNTSIAPSPRQPDGTLFVPSLSTPTLTVKSPVRSLSGEQITLSWRSQASTTYGVEASSDLENWTRIKTGLAGTPCQSSMSESLSIPAQSQRFYRVVEESKTIEGLWVALYDGTTLELVRIKLEGDQAVATKLIGDNIVRAGEVTWKASVTTGVGVMQFRTLDGSQSFWFRRELEIVSSDQIIIRAPQSEMLFWRVD